MSPNGWEAPKGRAKGLGVAEVREGAGNALGGGARIFEVKNQKNKPNLGRAQEVLEARLGSARGPWEFSGFFSGGFFRWSWAAGRAGG